MPLNLFHGLLTLPDAGAISTFSEFLFVSYSVSVQCVPFSEMHHLCENKDPDQLCSNFLLFIAPAYSRVRYRSSNFCPSVRSFVCPLVRPSTFTSKFSFLDISDSCESETLHSNCP